MPRSLSRPGKVGRRWEPYLARDHRAALHLLDESPIERFGERDVYVVLTTSDGSVVGELGLRTSMRRIEVEHRSFHAQRTAKVFGVSVFFSSHSFVSTLPTPPPIREIQALLSTQNT